MTPRPPEVTRWADAATDAEVPSELRQLIHAGRQQLGSPAEVASLAQSLARALGPAAGLGADSAGPGPFVPVAAAPARWAAWVAAGGAALTGAVAWWLVASGSPHELPPSGPPVAATPAAAPAAPAAPVDEAPALAEPLEAPDVERSRARAPAAKPRPRSQATSTQTPALPEADLLERAQSALSKQPKQALALTREHQRRFPRGLLVQEREVIAIEALNRLGRKRAASARAAEFEKRHRGSVHQPRLDGELGAAEVQGGRAPHAAPAAEPGPMAP